MEEIIKENIKESRIESLFTKDLNNLKELNYDGYLANLTNWELVINKFIENQVFSQNLLILNTESLNQLSYNLNGKIIKLQNGILNVVINHMVNDTEQLIPLSRFESTPLEKSLINKLVYKMISSTIYSLDYDVSTRNGGLKKDQLVSLSKLKELSLQIYDFYKYEYLTTEEYSDYVINKTHLFKLILQFKLTEQDFNLVLKYLSRDLKKIAVKNDEIIKFIKDDKDFIDENDESVSLLKATSFKLTNLIKQLSSKQLDLKKEILKNLSNGNKSLAKILLQNFKKIETNLANQSIQLSNLNTLLDQINQQSFNKTLISTITTNSQLLARLNQSTDLNNLEQVLDTMSENINESEKISDLLSSTNSNLDDKEIDQELKQLIESSNEKKLSKQEQDAKKQDEELTERFNNLKSSPLGKTEFGVNDGSAKKTELGKTELGKTELGKTEKGKTELGKTEVGKTEKGKTEVGKTEQGKTEVGKTEQGKTETGTVEDKSEDKSPVYA